MRKAPRVTAASAKVRLESTFSFLAASGLAEHRSGNLFAAPTTSINTDLSLVKKLSYNVL